MRNNRPAESEFVVINLFDSLNAVRRFAGEACAVPVFELERSPASVEFRPPLATHDEVRVRTA